MFEEQNRFDRFYYMYYIINSRFCFCIEIDLIRFLAFTAWCKILVLTN